jgi:hypothetical protein
VTPTMSCCTPLTPSTAQRATDFGASLFKLNGVTCALSSNDDVLVNAVGCLDITVMYVSARSALFLPR